MLIDSRDSGACALAAYLRDSTLWIANAGDCRAVLGTTREGTLCAVALSTDHKPDVPSESERIRSMGGMVRKSVGEVGSDDFIPARLFEEIQQPWKGPGLAISRSLGDLNAEKCGLIATPEIISHVVDTELDHYLILASDGVWEFISPERAVEIVHTAILKETLHAEEEEGGGGGAGGAITIGEQGPTNACRMLIAQSALEWRKHEGAYRDDITAIVLHLPSVVRELAKLDDAEQAEEEVEE